MLRSPLHLLFIATLVCASLLAAAICVRGEDATAAQNPAPQQAEREAAFAKLLSGATLDGNFTMTDVKADAATSAPQLMHDKYTLGEVKKLDGNQWQISARIQYGDKDFTLPLTLPVEWAADTPVIIVENVPLPGFSDMSARVMFFADHYAGFWQHGTHTGNLFGVIRHASDASPPKEKPSP